MEPIGRSLGADLKYAFIPPHIVLPICNIFYAPSASRPRRPRGMRIDDEGFLQCTTCIIYCTILWTYFEVGLVLIVTTNPFFSLQRTCNSRIYSVAHVVGFIF